MEYLLLSPSYAVLSGNVHFVWLWTKTEYWTYRVRYGVVSGGQTAFSFFFVVAEKGSGTLPLAVLCRESPDFGDWDQV